MRARVKPVSIPDDLHVLDRSPRRDVITLPLTVRWSDASPITYDLSTRSDRHRVLEQTLTEGTMQDVIDLVVLSDLLDAWDELVLPEHVCMAWVTALRDHEARRTTCRQISNDPFCGSSMITHRGHPARIWPWPAV